MIVVGWLLSRLLFSMLRTVTIGPFVVLPVFLLAVLWLFSISARLIRGYPGGWLTWIMLGICADGLLYWVLRQGSQTILPIGPWDPPAFTVSFGAAAALALLALLSHLLGRLRGVRARRVTWGHVAVLAGVFVLGVVAYRVGFELTRHIPNEERSILLFGYEIHHAYSGALVLAVIAMLYEDRCIANGYVVLAITGAAAASVLDQASYTFLRNVSDSAYAGVVSWTGAIVAGLAYLAYITWVRLRARDPEPAAADLGQKLLSHRVRGFGFPEHTPAAFRAALEAGIPYLEVDTRASSDGVLYLYHDPRAGGDIDEPFTFDRTTSEEIAARRYTDGQPLLTLAEALDLFAERRDGEQVLCLDIKDYGYEETHLELVRSRGLEQQIAFVSWIPQTLLRLYDLGTVSPLVLSHLNLRMLGPVGRFFSFAARNALIPFGSLVMIGSARFDAPLDGCATGYQHSLVCTDLPPRLASALAAHGGGIGVPMELIDARLLNYCHRHGLDVWFFTVRSTTEFLWYASRPEIGVIFSDNAAGMAQKIDEAGGTA